MNNSALENYIVSPIVKLPNPNLSFSENKKKTQHYNLRKEARRATEIVTNHSAGRGRSCYTEEAKDTSTQLSVRLIVCSYCGGATDKIQRTGN